MARAEAQQFSDSHPLRLFPTWIWRAELAEAVRERVDGVLLQAVEELRSPLGPLEPVGGWQSPQDLHLRPAFGELVACIEGAAAEVLQFLKVGHETPRITGCWLNVLASGRGHPAHSHPNNFLSGVYYVQTQAGANTINFHDPRPQTGVMRPPVTELTADNADQVVITVKDGVLLLFPAWLVHSVDANRSAAPRISVSFNLMFPDYAEVISKPMW